MSEFYTIGDNLVVRVKTEERTTASGLYIATKENGLLTGIVEVVGPGRYFMDGNLVRGLIRKGDTVWFSRQSAVPFEWKDGEKHYIVAENTVLGYETTSNPDDLPF